MNVCVDQKNIGLKKKASVATMRNEDDDAPPSRNSRLMMISVSSASAIVDARSTLNDWPNIQIQAAPHTACARRGGVVSMANSKRWWLAKLVAAMAQFSSSSRGKSP